MTIKPYRYQQDAIESMDARPGFILADDMGLGKTVTALAEISQASYQPDNVLIVCPNSVKGVWATHAAEILPEYPLLIMDSKNRGKTMTEWESLPGGILVVNWDALRLIPTLNGYKWDYIIADEAHMMKNRKALRTKALKKMSAKHKRALSGTPMVNRPDELWSILNWLYPKEFRSYWRFYKEFCDYKQHPQFGYYIFLGAKNMDELHELLKPFMIRRLKQNVLKELPDKYYTHLEIEMDPLQARAYKQMKKDSLAILEPQGDALAAPTVLAQLTRLRQFACSYAEIADDGHVVMSDPSPKLDRLMEIIDDTDSPVVVFSQFRQMVNLAAQRLWATKVPYEMIHGEVSTSDRDKAVRSFQEGKARVFLATMQTGGVGITLTAASTVVFLDRSWSPAMNLQAEDRLHRIGQKNAVQVIALQSVGTVDKTVESKLELKWSWIKKIIG